MARIDPQPSFRLTRRCSIRELALADEAIPDSNLTYSRGNAIGTSMLENLDRQFCQIGKCRSLAMIRKLALGTASVLALGMGGAALDLAANADDFANAASAPSYHWINATSLSKDDIRWAQVELHTIGLYYGSLDGVAGPETKRALLEFQENNGLERTATLDQQTADLLVGHTGVGRVSSMPPKGTGGG